MAKIRGDWSGQLRRAFKGSAYVYQRGNDIVLAAMPTRQKKEKSAKQLAAMDLMRQRSLAIKVMAPELVQHASFYAKGTALMPRDWLFMSLAGRGVSAFLPRAYIDGEYANDGIEGQEQLGPPMTPTDFPPLMTDLERIYPMAALNDLTTLLDIFGDQVGTIIFRDAAGWRGLAPGLPGQVLSLDAGGALKWSQGGGAGGGFSIAFVTTTATSGNAGATKGAISRGQLPILYEAANVEMSFTSGHRYQAALASFDNNEITAVHDRSDVWVAPASGTSTRVFTFANQYSAVPDEEVAILITDLDADPSFALPIRYANTPMLNFPGTDKEPRGFRIASNMPDIGTAITAFSAQTLYAALPCWSL